MKIETLNEDWKPIVVTIETREEAQELFDLIFDSETTPVLWYDLYDMIREQLK